MTKKAATTFCDFRQRISSNECPTVDMESGILAGSCVTRPLGRVSTRRDGAI